MLSRQCKSGVCISSKIINIQFSAATGLPSVQFNMVSLSTRQGINAMKMCVAVKYRGSVEKKISKNQKQGGNLGGNLV